MMTAKTTALTHLTLPVSSYTTGQCHELNWATVATQQVVVDNLEALVITAKI